MKDLNKRSDTFDSRFEADVFPFDESGALPREPP